MKTQLGIGMTILAVAVVGCGADAEQPASAPVAGNGTDRAFVAAMIPHHESAVEMAEIAKTRADSDFVRKLADDIVATQNDEIALMGDEDNALADAGIQPGKLTVPAHEMGMDMDPAALKTADPFDAAFIRMMIPHHEGAVEMANEELEKGADPELKRLAQAMIDAQQREIDEMIEHSRGYGEHGGHGG